MRIGKPPAAPAASTAFKDFTTAMSVLAELAKRDGELRDEELSRMDEGEHDEGEAAQTATATRAAAEELLKGSAPAPRSRKRAFRDLVQDRATIKLALELGRDRADQLRLASAAERLAEKQPELREIGRKMVLGVFAIEKIMQERDLLITEISMQAGLLPHEGWVGWGRLENTASTAYRLAETAVQNNWITQREFDQAHAEAKRLAIWR